MRQTCLYIYIYTHTYIHTFILLSVYIMAVSGLMLCLFSNSLSSNALCMANCSAWLFEHLSSNFSFYLAIMSLPLNVHSLEYGMFCSATECSGACSINCTKKTYIHTYIHTHTFCIYSYRILAVLVQYSQGFVRPLLYIKPDEV